MRRPVSQRGFVNRCRRTVVFGRDRRCKPCCDNDWSLIRALNEQPGDFTELMRLQVTSPTMTLPTVAEENSLRSRVSLRNYCATVLPEPADANGCE